MKFTNEPQIPLTMKEPCPPKKLFGCRFWSPAPPFVWFVTPTYLWFVPQRVAVRCVAVCFSGFQCVAVCCSVLQCAVVCCFVLQCVAVCCCVLCSVLPCIVVCCSVLHCVASLQHTETHYTDRMLLAGCSMLQCVAVCCSEAMHCNTLLLRVDVSLQHNTTRCKDRISSGGVQRDAVCCSVLQHVDPWEAWPSSLATFYWDMWLTNTRLHTPPHIHTYPHTYTHTHTHTWTHT